MATEVPATHGETVVQRAHLLTLRGNHAEARRLLAELLRDDPANTEAADLLSRVEVREAEQKERGWDRLELGDRARHLLGGGMRLLGWLAAFTAVWFVYTVINPTKINRHPRAGELPVEMTYYREHFPISEPLRLALAVPLLIGGVALHVGGKRIGRIGWDWE